MVFKRTYAVLLLITLVLVQHKCNIFAEGMLQQTLLLLAVVVQQTHCCCDVGTPTSILLFAAGAVVSGAAYMEWCSY
jgi:hypothetical protein